MRTIKETQFTAWMEQNKFELEQTQLLEELLKNPEENADQIHKIKKLKRDHEPWGFEIVYPEYPKYYSWSNPKRKWIRRGRKVIFSVIYITISVTCL